MSKARLGAGDVDIELDGEAVTLRPTLRAAQTISRQTGGFMGAIQSLRSLDIDALTDIIAAGLGKEPRDIAEAVYRSGAASLTPAATEFVSILANGGRPADKASGGEGEADPPTD